LYSWIYGLGLNQKWETKSEMRDKSSPTVNTSEIKYLAYSHTQKNCTKNLLLCQLKCRKYILLLCQLKCTKYILDTLKKHTQQTQILSIWFNSGFSTLSYLIQFWIYNIKCKQHNNNIILKAKLFFIKPDSNW